MAIYAISDLHLSFADPKPMDIFGEVWEDYTERLCLNWDRMVAPGDIVLLPGDLSWALRFDDAAPDLAFIAERPGRKILTRGNHDYWWHRDATSRIQRASDSSLTFLQGNSIVFDDVGITGARGWRQDWDVTPGSGADQDDKIYRRELAYLEKGLRSIPESVRTRIVMLHFPPFDESLKPNDFAHMLREYSVDHLVYGHIHLGLGEWIDGDVLGVQYHMVSADIVDFMPRLII